MTQHVGLYVQTDETHLVLEGAGRVQDAGVVSGKRLHDPRMMEERIRYARWVKRKSVDTGESEETERGQEIEKWEHLRG